MDTTPVKQANNRLVVQLLGITALMFAFGYSLVPLYNVFCEITGTNGKTGRLAPAQAALLVPDESREITVEFVTNVNAGLPWDFRALTSSVRVRPGVITQVEFEVGNRATQTLVGQAVPSLAPNTAARYFSKTECFCFSQQPLAGGEKKAMPVRFIIDPKLPADIETVTLSYTFFEAPPNPQQGSAPGDAPKT